MLTLYIIGILVGIGILGALAYLIYGAYIDANDIQPQTPKVSYVENAKLDTIIVDDTFDVNTIIAATQNATLGKHEFVLKNADDVLLPTTLVFELVTPDLPSRVRQYITDVRFITVDRSQPLMFVKLANQSALQGELLAIETTLPETFAPLYAHGSDATFVDQQINSVDVRVLTDPLGRTYLTYGFVDDETLVIAGTLEDFATLVRY